MRSFHVLVYSFVLSILLAMSASARPVTIVALGDSLTAGYQLPASAALPAALERSLRAAGVDVRIENAGVSGDTSSGGLERLDWATPDGIDGVILALGANDMLRGLDPRLTEKALDETIRRLKSRNIAVLLVGMVAPPSMGKEYVSSFNGIYPKLAERHGVALYPFMLEGIAQNPKLNLPDGIHPNRDGVEVIAKGMLPLVTQFVEQIARGKTPGR